MDMIIPILLAVAALVAVLDAASEERYDHDTDERESSRSHSGMIGVQCEELVGASGMMSSMADDAMAWEIGCREGIFSTSCVTGNGGWRETDHQHRFAVNPANGLPMAGGCEFGVDIMGNPYGTDFQHDQSGYVHDSYIGGMDLFGSSSRYPGSLGGSDDWS